jgi:hypothetical protein
MRTDKRKTLDHFNLWMLSHKIGETSTFCGDINYRLRRIGWG